MGIWEMVSRGVDFVVFFRVVFFIMSPLRGFCYSCYRFFAIIISPLCGWV